MLDICRVRRAGGPSAGDAASPLALLRRNLRGCSTRWYRTVWNEIWEIGAGKHRAALIHLGRDARGNSTRHTLGILQNERRSLRWGCARRLLDLPNVRHVQLLPRTRRPGAKRTAFGRFAQDMRDILGSETALEPRTRGGLRLCFRSGPDTCPATLDCRGSLRLLRR